MTTLNEIIQKWRKDRSDPSKLHYINELKKLVDAKLEKQKQSRKKPGEG